MVKNIVYINLIFLSILSVYFFAQNFDSGLFNSFYLLFSLFCITCSLVLLFSDLGYRESKEREAYRLLFIGLLSFGFGNLLWFLNDTYFQGNISVNFINVFFLFQLLTKYSFFKFLRKDSGDSDIPTKLIHFSFLFVLLILFSEAYSISSFLTSIFNIFFIAESLITVYYVGLKLLNDDIKLIDFRYFIAGTIVWLLADVSYLIDIDLNKYSMGNIVDFMYFLGFYLIISSIIYKSFRVEKTFNSLFEKKLFYI